MTDPATEYEDTVSTAQVCATLLAAGWRWEPLAPGLRPVLTNAAPSAWYVETCARRQRKARADAQAYYWQHRTQILAQKAAYYQRHRPRILQQARARYATKTHRSTQ